MRKATIASALAALLGAAMVHAQPPAFDVASIKPFKDDGVRPRNSRTYGPQGINFGGVTLAFIVGEAYNFPVGRIQGTGSLTKEALWAPLREGYDVAARTDHPVSKRELLLMLQSLLADRFKLALHWETRTQPVYQLVIAKGGPKFEASPESEEGFSMSGSSSEYVFRNAEMMRLTGFLSGQVDRVVIDGTGLKGVYNFTFRRPEEVRQDQPVKSDGRSPDSPSTAAFAEALKPLGLQLISTRAPVDYLIIDQVEQPSGN